MDFSGSFLPGVFSYNKNREQNAHCQTVEKPDKIRLFLVRMNSEERKTKIRQLEEEARIEKRRLLGNEQDIS